MMRKIYQGQGGVLPPSDPRLHDLTEEQINLDLLHYQLDHPEKFKEVYTDDAYEEEVAAALEEDSSEGPAPDKASEVHKEEPEDWEDIPDDELATKEE